MRTKDRRVDIWHGSSAAILTALAMQQHSTRFEKVTRILRQGRSELGSSA